jgi:hypothetical protein
VSQDKVQGTRRAACLNPLSVVSVPRAAGDCSAHFTDVYGRSSGDTSSHEDGAQDSDCCGPTDPDLVGVLAGDGDGRGTGDPAALGDGEFLAC